MQSIFVTHKYKRFGTLLKLARSHLFPTKFDKELRRWWKEGGDQRFRFDYDLNQNSLVLDLGGFRGDWADQIWQQYGCSLHIFEPVQEFYQALQQRFKNNSQIKVHAFGLGSSSREETIALCQDGSSVFRSADNQELIQIKDIVSWLSEYSIENVDLVKINIEGGEYELLERLIESGQIALFKNIQVQFHNINETSFARMRQIQEYLARTHLPIYQFEFVWESWQKRQELS